MSSSDNIPQEFICPITFSIMDDPVICEDGYTYERSAILQVPNSISPITRQYINKNNLIPNRAIKDSIQRFKELHGSNSNNLSAPISLTNSISSTNLTNPQLTIPESEKTIQIVRSGWDDNIYKITTQIKPDDWVDRRVRTTLIAVLDTSGSMGESCSVGGEQDGFSRLNLVQHSMNTVIQMLHPDDELVIVQFNSQANYVFNEKITQHNKPRAKSIIDSLTPGGGTYIWNGLRLAYDAARRASNSNVHIMLLTDGQSNDDPFSELRRFFSSESNQSVRTTKLTTFGFSYDINSKSLFDIAEYANSSFNFIPDASMVGTVFCNYLANILSPDLFVCQIEKITWSITQSDPILNFNQIGELTQYELIRFHCYQILKDTCMKSGTVRRLSDEITGQINLFKVFLQNIRFTPGSLQSILLSNLIKDFVSDDESHEQITKAISRSDWFNKWGYHYLLSLSLAHLTRTCHNYKDQGVQLYGNTLFQSLQEQVYQIFSSIQPPRPSLRAQVVRTSMSAYVDRSGGCFGPECKIRLVDGTLKQLNKLTGDELVYQGDGIVGSKIKYIIQTEIPQGKKFMCKIGDLIISEFHPIYSTNSSGWVFPTHLVVSEEIEITHMYNIILESGFWVEIEGIKCVSLGHQLDSFDSNNKILSHDYFGTHKVIEDLENFSRITCQSADKSVNKIIRVYNYETLRDPLTNLVIGIKPKN